jgi:hypothetical protein
MLLCAPCFTSRRRQTFDRGKLCSLDPCRRELLVFIWCAVHANILVRAWSANDEVVLNENIGLSVENLTGISFNRDCLQRHDYDCCARAKRQ